MFPKKTLCSLFIFIAGSLWLTVGFAQQLKIHHLDVGGGDATLIVAYNATGSVAATVLIDGGDPPYGSVIQRYISTLNINNTINYIIASHYDQDHIGGLTWLLNNMASSHLTVGTIMDRGTVPTPKGQNNPQSPYRKYAAAKVASGVPTSVINPGRTFTLYTDPQNPQLNMVMKCFCVNAKVLDKNGVAVDVPTTQKSKPDENDLSTGFLITYGKFSYLTCGDIGGKEKKQQNDNCGSSWTSKYRDIESSFIGSVSFAHSSTQSEEQLQIDAYKVNHHGSKNSTNEAWLTYTKALVAVISSGSKRHQHPNAEVTNDLNSNDIIRNYYLTATQNYFHRNLDNGKGVVNTLNPTTGYGYPIIIQVDNTITVKDSFNVFIGSNNTIPYSRP